MSYLSIRLALHGCANRPFYHIVVMGRKRPMDGKPIEQLGTFDPLVNKHNEKLVALNFERLRYYLARGATPSKPAAELLGLSGFLPIHPITRIKAKRRQLLQAATGDVVANAGQQKSSLEVPKSSTDTSNINSTPQS